MLSLVAAAALSTFGGGEEELKAEILRKVEAMIKAEHAKILEEVKKLLAPKKLPGFLGINGKELADGIQIQSVIGGSPASFVGLQKDDVVLSVNGKKVAKLQELVATFREIGAGGKVVLEVKRGDKTFKKTARLCVRQDDDDEDGDDDDDDGDDDDDDD